MLHQSNAPLACSTDIKPARKPLARRRGSVAGEHLFALMLLGLAGIAGMGTLGGAMRVDIAASADGHAMVAPRGAPAPNAALQGQAGTSETEAAAANETMSEEDAAALASMALLLRDSLVAHDIEAVEDARDALGTEGFAALLQVADASRIATGRSLLNKPSTDGLNDEEIARLALSVYGAHGVVAMERTLKPLDNERRASVQEHIQALAEAEGDSLYTDAAKTGDPSSFFGGVKRVFGSLWHHSGQPREGSFFARTLDTVGDVLLDAGNTVVGGAMTGLRLVWDGTGLDSLLGTETRESDRILDGWRDAPEPTAGEFGESIVAANLFERGLLTADEVLALTSDDAPASFADPLDNLRAAFLASMSADGRKQRAEADCSWLCGLGNRLPFVSTSTENAAREAEDARRAFEHGFSEYVKAAPDSELARLTEAVFDASNQDAAAANRDLFVALLRPVFTPAATELLMIDPDAAQELSLALGGASPSAMVAEGLGIRLEAAPSSEGAIAR